METLSPYGVFCSGIHYRSVTRKLSLLLHAATPASHQATPEKRLSMLIKTTLLCMAFTITSGIASASTFIALQSGNWSNPVTWNGNAPGSEINAPDTIVIPAGVFITLGSNVRVIDQLAMVIINGTLQGNSYLIMEAGTLSGAGSVHNIGVKIMDKSGVSLLSDMMVTGMLAISEGSLFLNGYNLTIQGNISCTGSGSITAGSTSGITFTGSGAIGNLIFAPQGNTIYNLTMNTSAAGTISLGSDVSVNGVLNLGSGLINLGNFSVTIIDAGQIYGGNAASYLVTNQTDTGKLMMYISGDGGYGIFEIGTENNYAPVRIDNNSPGGGNFGGYVLSGILADQNSGGQPGNDAGAVNATWNFWSDVTVPAGVLVSVYWNADMADKSFNAGQVYIAQYENDEWDSVSAAMAFSQINGLYMAQRQGFHTLGKMAVLSTYQGAESVTATAQYASINVYPVPAITQVNLLIPQHQKYSHIKVYDVLGNQVYQAQLHADVTIIDVSGFSPGEYFIRIDDAITKSFIKN